LILKFSITKVSTSPLRNPQRIRSLSILSPHQTGHKDLALVLQYQSPQRGGQYKLFRISTQFWNSRTTPSRLGDESPRVTNTHEIVEEVDEVLLLDSLKESLKSSLKKMRLRGGLEREWMSLRVSFLRSRMRARSGIFSKEGVDPYL
jgi:hypothetical protein